MVFSFSDTIGRKRITLLAALAVALCGVLCVFFGEIVLPVFAAFYAVLILADTSYKKIISLALGAVSLAATVSLYLLGFGTLSLPFACLGGALIALLFGRGASKGELAFYLTAAFTLMLVVSLYLMFAAAAGDYSLNAVVEFVNGWYTQLRSEFVGQIMESLSAASSEIFVGMDEITLTESFDSVFDMALSVVVLLAFLLAGISLKIFSALMYRIAKEPSVVVFWRFSTSNIVAYFYCALFVLSFFAGGDGVYAITVSNLFNVFLAVYAYIGFNFALSIVSGKLGYTLSVIILIAGILFLGVIGLEILSALGVIFTHISNKVGWHIDNNKS